VPSSLACHDFGQCSVPGGLDGVTAIAAGFDQSRRPGRVLPARSNINLIVSRGRKR
jgi:hypothetical protein